MSSQFQNLQEYDLFDCYGTSIINGKLSKCENLSNKQYCLEHKYRYRLEKPDDCPICMENISLYSETPLECGHWIHKNCLIPTNIHKCPVCRQNMKSHEIEYIFGKNHYENNFFQSGLDFINVPIDIYNNQEHFFNDYPYLANEHDMSELDNEYVINEPVILSPEYIDLIIREIEISPRNNSYINVSSNLTEVPDEFKDVFENYINGLIRNFMYNNNVEINENIIEQIKITLCENEQDLNLMSICYNLISIPHITVDFISRIESIVNVKINDIFNLLN